MPRHTGRMRASRGASPFLGREQELNALRDALSDATRQEPSLAIVVGEAGMGKTRLLAEFEKQCRDEGAVVVRGACVAVGAGELPLRSLDRGHACARDGDRDE